MKEYRITPVNFCGATAPTFFVDATDEKNALQEAKKHSRLGDFNNWMFLVKKV